MTLTVRLLLARMLWALTVMPAGAEPVLFTPQHGLSGPSRGDGSLAFFSAVLGLFVSKVWDEATRHWTIHETMPLHYTAPEQCAGPVRHTIGRRLFLA